MLNLLRFQEDGGRERYAEYLAVEDWPAQPRPLPDLKPCIEALRTYAAHMRSLALPEAQSYADLMRLEVDQPSWRGIE